MELTEEVRRECDELFGRLEARLDSDPPRTDGILKRLDLIDQHLSEMIAALEAGQAARRKRRKLDGV